MIRTPQALAPYALALACLTAGGLWHLADRTPGLREVRTVGTPRVGGPFEMLDQNGMTRTDAEFRGRWMWVYFGYTHCPDVCPTTLALMSEVLKQLEGRRNQIVPIFITLDPARDRPRVLKAYLAAFDPRFIGLTGTATKIAAVAKAYRVYRATRPLKSGGYSIDHSNVFCLIGPDGKFAAVYDNSQTAEQIVADLRRRL